MPALKLPLDGGLVDYAVRNAPLPAPARPAIFNRVAYAAAHVVVDPLADIDPVEGQAIDWDATIAYREYLWSLGFGIAEAMDTAQRGMGLDWPSARELIRRSQAAAVILARICSNGMTVRSIWR